ncbi:MAG: zinc transporter ZupT [Deltaproteobacteria bacterium]|nr:zinc transporter ZupT [Deltaproteobacteria bacterium]
MDDHVLLAFGLTLFAGLSTGIGSAIGFFARKTNTRFLSAALGFSAGVMIYVSFTEILTKAVASIATVRDPSTAAWLGTGGFFAGILLIAVIDRLIPSYENPHEARPVEQLRECSPEGAAAAGMPSPAAAAPGREKRLLRMGMFSALAIGIHNFPEGLATFAAALNDPAIGISIAVAIAIHNIPEGIAVSVPIYYATGSRKKAFWLSFLSGLSEPLGALIGFLILRAFFTPLVFGLVFAGVGGIMVFISLDELFPTAREYGQGHLAIYGLVAGMAVMAVSLLLFL